MGEEKKMNEITIKSDSIQFHNKVESVSDVRLAKQVLKELEMELQKKEEKANNDSNKKDSDDE